MLFRHFGNLKLYKLIGKARSVENPEKIQIIYKQLYKSKLRSDGEAIKGDIILPYGSIWIRDESDFRAKFKKIN
jgi:hypothetical protein